MNIRLIRLLLNELQNEVYFGNGYLSSSLFSYTSRFNLSITKLFNPTPSKQTNLSCSFNIKLNPTDSVFISVFHNLFYPEPIYNNHIEKIKWSLKAKGRVICSGNVISGHSFQFDENLITGANGPVSKCLAETNPDLHQTIRNNLEELNKHFFHFTLDLSSADGANEFELKFDFPDFKPGYSVGDIIFSFNDVVPVIDIIRKQESFEGLQKGFNLWTLSKTDSSNFLGISAVWLRNRFNQVLTISELDLENQKEGESNYKLISSENYPDREQEIIYLKNHVPLPFNKSDKTNLLAKLTQSITTNEKLSSGEIAMIDAALSRNYAENTGHENKPEIIINNCFDDQAEVFATYLYDTSAISQSEKPLYYNGNEVEYEIVPLHLEADSKVRMQAISSKYDFFRAASDFFGYQNIENAEAAYQRDFTEDGTWQATLNVHVIFRPKFDPDFSQWEYFTAICRSRCVYADVRIHFSFEVKN